MYPRMWFKGVPSLMENASTGRSYQMLKDCGWGRIPLFDVHMSRRYATADIQTSSFTVQEIVRDKYRRSMVKTIMWFNAQPTVLIQVFPSSSLG
jgi:hypothetical protein